MNLDKLLKLWKDCAITAENSGEWKQPITVMAGVIIGVNQELKRLLDLEAEQTAEVERFKNNNEASRKMEAERKRIAEELESLVDNTLRNGKVRIQFHLLINRILAGEFAKGGK